MGVQDESTVRKRKQQRLDTEESRGSSDHPHYDSPEPADTRPGDLADDEVAHEDCDSDLMEPLVPGDQVARDDTSGRIMVRVTAPANLPAGYTFVAEVNGDPQRTFTCEVVRAAYFRPKEIDFGD